MDILEAAALPWLRSTRKRLRDAAVAQRLPHSLLVLSAPGLGAALLGNWLAAFVLCDSAAQRPCGICASCLLLKADSHPDYHLACLAEDAQQIKIEQIRELIEVLRFSAYRGGYKVGVVEAAETLNAAGANAFLKTLEEPTDKTLLIMLAKPAHRLPATIASRCLRINLRPPPKDEALAWLKTRSSNETWDAALALAGGAPLLALELPRSVMADLERDMQQGLKAVIDGTHDVTLIAERWNKSNPAHRLVWLENWITQRVHSGLGMSVDAQNAERVRLSAALLKPKIRALFELLDAVRDLRRFAATSMNQQLALESLLLLFNGTVGIAKSK